MRLFSQNNNLITLKTMIWKCNLVYGTSRDVSLKVLVVMNACTLKEVTDEMLASRKFHGD
jgi:hypothetical protein